VEDKDCEWAAAAFGMVGLETALSVVCAAMIETGLLDWAGVADRMSVRPARIGRLADHGRLQPAETPRSSASGTGKTKVPGDPSRASSSARLADGLVANLTLVDPAARWTVDPAALASRSRNTPFAGQELPARVVATFLRGRPTVIDGKPA
jgi:dihydroorotase